MAHVEPAKSAPRPLPTPPAAAGRRFAVAAARFNAAIVDRLVDGAVECLAHHGAGADAVDVVRVPGAWELPVVVDALAATGRYAGIVALGAVVRGDTPHFDFVAGGCADGLARAAERHGLPVGFGVLTCDDVHQAEARAGGEAGNKGREAALAVLETAEVLARIRGEAGRP